MRAAQAAAVAGVSVSDPETASPIANPDNVTNVTVAALSTDQFIRTVTPTAARLDLGQGDDLREMLVSYASTIAYHKNAELTFGATDFAAAGKDDAFVGQVRQDIDAIGEYRDEIRGELRERLYYELAYNSGDDYEARMGRVDALVERIDTSFDSALNENPNRNIPALVEALEPATGLTVMEKSSKAEQEYLAEMERHNREMQARMLGDSTDDYDMLTEMAKKAREKMNQPIGNKQFARDNAISTAENLFMRDAAAFGGAEEAKFQAGLAGALNIHVLNTTHPRQVASGVVYGTIGIAKGSFNTIFPSIQDGFDAFMNSPKAREVSNDEEYATIKKIWENVKSGSVASYEGVEEMLQTAGPRMKAEFHKHLDIVKTQDMVEEMRATSDLLTAALARRPDGTWNQDLLTPEAWRALNTASTTYADTPTNRARNRVGENRPDHTLDKEAVLALWDHVSTLGPAQRDRIFPGMTREGLENETDRVAVADLLPLLHVETSKRAFALTGIIPKGDHIVRTAQVAQDWETARYHGGSFRANMYGENGIQADAGKMAMFQREGLVTNWNGPAPSRVAEAETPEAPTLPTRATETAELRR